MSGAGERRVTLVIDRDRCEGHAQCVLVAPTLLSIDDAGETVVDVADVTDQLDLAKTAVQTCPAIALRIE